MYMPTTHDYSEGLAKKLSKSTAWKYKKKEAKAEKKRKATKATIAYSSPPSKL